MTCTTPLLKQPLPQGHVGILSKAGFAPTPLKAATSNPSAVFLNGYSFDIDSGIHDGLRSVNTTSGYGAPDTPGFSSPIP